MLSVRVAATNFKFDATGFSVMFERNTYSYKEGEGPMEVCVNATSFNINSTAEIELQVAGGSATSQSCSMCTTTL